MTPQKLHGVRMWVTEGCNASCHFCMNMKSRMNSQMNISKFEELCYYFKQNGFDKIAIMGGEPTIHPNFLQIMELSQKYFPSVYLFTNAIEGEILTQYLPRKTDTIIYNFSFSQSVTKNALLLNNLGERIFDVVIDHSVDSDQIVSNMKQIIELLEGDIMRFKVQLVINNTCNIFKHKKKIIYNLNTIYNKLSQIKGINLVFECNAPPCFTYGVEMPSFKQNTFCSPRAVLVDGSYNVRFCNIYDSVLVNMFQDNGIIPFSILENYINMAYNKLRIDCLDKICKDCMFYSRQCNGKCHIGLASIKKEDICLTTKLPWFKS